MQPMAPYAKALADAGDEVMVATSEAFRPAVERLGLDSVGIGLDFTWEDPTGRFPQLVEARREGRIGDALLEIVWDEWVSAAMTDLTQIIDTWKPDLIVREALEYAAMFAARITETPLAAAAWGTVQADHSWELDGVGFDRFCASHDRLAETMGLAGDARDRWANEFTLSSLPPSWIPRELEPRPPLHHFRIPPLDGASVGDSWPARPADARPLVYATLGTVYWWDHELRSVLLEAVSEIDADVVMTVGRRVDPTRIATPGNVRVEQYVPQSLLLPEASAVVCHGGLGTMIGAIAAGVPMVLIDLGTDHTMNARRATELGIAESFTRAEIAPAPLAAAVQRALEHPGRRASAKRIAEEYAALQPSTSAVEVLHRHAQA
ncbi:MAG: hypothetical protein QOD39_1266 [Mycobacterium sp.]|nr:hypothetical protein [Mycobacterium sp.]